MFHYIVEHFKRLGSLSEGRFLVWVTIESLAIQVVLACILFSFWPDRLTSHGKYGTALMISILVLVAPVLETLVLQSFPAMLVRNASFGPRMCFLGAWIPFAVVHFANSIPSGICAGIVGGFYLAFTHETWLAESFRKGFWMTCIAHALHNAPLAVLILVRRAL